MSQRAPTEPLARRLRALPGAAALIVVALFMALLVYGVIARSPDTSIDESLARAQAPAAPEFELALLQGGSPGPLASKLRRARADGRVALDELRGVPVVINFWASWCVPCRAEARVLERSWLAQRRRRVLFLGLNMQDLTDDAHAFLREFEVSYPNVRDPTNRVARRWGVTGIPETFFLSRGGRIVGHVIGAVSAGQLREGVAAAEAGRPQAARQGGERRATR